MCASEIMIEAGLASSCKFTFDFLPSDFVGLVIIYLYIILSYFFGASAQAVSLYLLHGRVNILPINLIRIQMHVGPYLGPNTLCNG